MQLSTHNTQVKEVISKSFYETRLWLKPPTQLTVKSIIIHTQVNHCIKEILETSTNAGKAKEILREMRRIVVDLYTSRTKQIKYTMQIKYN